MVLCIVSLLLCLTLAGFFVEGEWRKGEPSREAQPSQAPVPRPVDKETTEETQETKETKQEERTEERASFPDIPFYVQAPSGNWANPIFQNACEEVSVLMVADALAGVTKTIPEQERVLQEIALWQRKKFGTSVDTNALDTATTLREYLEVDNVTVVEITPTTLKEALQQGQVALVPAHGQKLKNPYFQPPGPITHMLVVFGYDENKDEFIVHDPGTRRGGDYHYASAVLFSALGDYPTGNHVKSDKEALKKAILVGPSGDETF